MAGPRVHSFLPGQLHGILAYALGDGIEHVAHEGHPVRAAEAAVLDDAAVAFVGPLLSWQAAETAAILSEAGIAQLLPGATDLAPAGERTLFRLAPSDAAIARAVVAAHPRARLVSDRSGYGIQISSHLRSAGLEVDDTASLTIYAGLAKTAPPLEAPVLAFEGAAVDGFPAVFALPQRGGEGWPDADAILYGPQTKEAGMLIYGSAMAGGPTRAGVLLGLRSCGRFDEHGDTRERKIGLWRWVDGALAPDGVLEDPGD